MSTIFVAIAGGSASGKTTFAAELRQALQDGAPPVSVDVIGMDRYFYRGAPGGPTFVSPATGEVLPDNNHPESADNDKLLADLDAMAADDSAAEVVLVEGLMALHVAQLRRRFDLRIYVELEDDLRALRRLLRDMRGGRGSTDPAWIATYYRECARAGHTLYVEPSRVHADLIIRGDGDFGRTAALAAACVRERLRSVMAAGQPAGRAGTVAPEA
ncbi:MAG: hypothetical protein KGJ62_09975 [Armatimonadetes bacterium]|nr:hypothetical protein [Armatimonadota bacterium]MDE2207518.1 hypothetical protein [Armatimonadota bacterium]